MLLVENKKLSSWPLGMYGIIQKEQRKNECKLINITMSAFKTSIGKMLA